ncbi:30S ribosomal protein S5 [Candidatus Woesearchaeota archaeon]|nr:30S ribosomal protein S5 [Candidatus Woesearchaeota archaeon]
MPKIKKKLIEEKEKIEQEVIQKEEKIEKKEIKKEIKKTTRKEFDAAAWTPKTEIGKKIKNGEITDIDQVLDSGAKILEAEIVDVLIKNPVSDLILIGQSKGKFGGGSRRVFKQVQKKTAEGNKPRFATAAVFGNQNGYVGVGFGKAKETVPAREKAIRNAKLNLIKIRRGCGSWQCGCKEPHTIPFIVEGKCGSVKVKLIPAPKGTGLATEKEIAKILKMAGLKDVWSKTFGHTVSKINLIVACMNALKKLTTTKIKPDHIETLGICEGAQKKKEEDKEEEIEEATPAEADTKKSDSSPKPKEKGSKEEKGEQKK